MCKPDVDNIAKAVLDALNGVIWVDDKQVVELTVKKYYGTSNEIQIEIEDKEYT